MRNFMHGQRGFTLVEVIASIGIFTMVTGTMSAAMSQAFSAQNRVINDGLAINELRKGLSWFSGDMKKAQSTNLINGGASSDSITVTWTDQFQGAGTPHSVTYALIGDSLLRTFDGVSHTVGRGVSSVAFSLSNKTIAGEIQVFVKPGVTRTLSVEAVMRASSG